MTTPTHNAAARPDTRMFVRSEGRIAYDDRGAGPLLVLVPGMGDVRASYRFLAPLLEARGYRVVTADLRGHGESDTSFAHYGDVATAGDIAALLEHLGEPAVVVGNSMAAGSAVIVAAEYPERVRGVVLVGPFVRDPESDSTLKRAVFRLVLARPWIVATWKAYLPTLFGGKKPADFAAYRNTVVAALKRPGYARAFGLTARTTHAEAAACLPRVKAPVLIVMGERDPDFGEPAEEAAWISQTVGGGAEVALIADAGHYPHAQQPDAVGAAMKSFLAAVHRNA